MYYYIVITNQNQRKYMKKIINGKKYDTSTALRIGNFWNGLSDGDFSSLSETLYKKKTGEFFLHGEGGAMSRYSRSVGQNTWSGGSAIVPISAEEAKEWAEANLSSDEYETAFGQVEE